MYTCANCIDGKCFDPDRLFSRDRRDEPPCYAVNKEYTISEGGIDCDYFLLNVLPADPELNRLVWSELQKDPEAVGVLPVLTKACAVCARPFLPSSNRQRFCRACAEDAERKRNAASHRARYWNG